MKKIIKESVEETQKRLQALTEKINRYMKQPWSIYQKPFQIADHLYYVGNSYVASYLIDTGDGLVLIDCGFCETLYQLIHSIHLLGYSPTDIRYLFLSHGHFDHCGAAGPLQKLSEAEVYIGREDVFFFEKRRDLIHFEDHTPEFPIHGCYDYERPWRIGSTVFRFAHTPGHTPGCTSFLIETTHHGNPVVCAMHGGLGINGLTYRELDEAGLPRSLHQAFYEQLQMCRIWKVDIPCPSHNHDYDILSLAARVDESRDCFVNPDGWSAMIERKIQQYLPLL